MRVEPASDSALFISFGDAISLETHRRVISLFQALEGLRDPRIRNLHPAYSSVLIDFDPLQLTHDELEKLLTPLLLEFDSSNLDKDFPIEIPVCYEPEFAPDLSTISAQSRLTEDQVIAMHCGGDYYVCFLGFSPGFAYLGGLPNQLYVPRLITPRKHAYAGSVGLAGAQTGIYPNDSPGGWQLIGRTPLRMFDGSNDPPSRLQPGDRVRFRRIERAEFDRVAREQVQSR
jgi:KipI family sensor histidine kinase inhibitor